MTYIPSGAYSFNQPNPGFGFVKNHASSIGINASLPSPNFLGQMAGNSELINMGTEIGAAGLNTLFNQNGRMSDGQAGAVGALSGAGKGLAIGSNPLLMGATGGLSVPIGAAIGAISGGAIGGHRNKMDRKRGQMFNREMLQNNMTNSLNIYKNSAIPNVYGNSGSNSYGSYAHGGNTNSTYEVEGGEVMMQTGYQKPMALNGGYMKSISPSMQEIKGQSHENGGVEGMNDGFVFSKRLKTDSSKFLKRL